MGAVSRVGMGGSSRWHSQCVANSDAAAMRNSSVPRRVDLGDRNVARPSPPGVGQRGPKWIDVAYRGPPMTFRRAGRPTGMPCSALAVNDLTCEAVTVDASPLAPEAFEKHRRELTGYCYRMLGSGFEADDAVQETMLRAWKAADRFEGRSSVRSWLYRIATNVCLDMLRSRQRRARPMELGTSSPPEESYLKSTLPENRWVSPIADSRVMSDDAAPAEIAAERESIRLAFVTALQHLPAR